MAEDHSPADEDLVQATLAGREEAFAELVRRHKRRVFATAARFARDSHQLDDLAQEVFLRAYRRSFSLLAKSLSRAAKWGETSSEAAE